MTQTKQRESPIIWVRDGDMVIKVGQTLIVTMGDKVEILREAIECPVDPIPGTQPGCYPVQTDVPG